jgi:hypothetical protein
MRTLSYLELLDLSILLKQKAKQNKIKRRSKKNSYHVTNKNIASSKITDIVGNERGDAFWGIPKLSCLGLPLILPWGALGIPKLRVLPLAQRLELAALGVGQRRGALRGETGQHRGEQEREEAGQGRQGGTR